ncbi:MAG: hypothetical protein U0807_06290 [Candidatus Binatia bacterium]
MPNRLIPVVLLALALGLATRDEAEAKRHYINGARIRPGSLTEQQVQPGSLSASVLTPETQAALGAPNNAIMTTKGQAKVQLQGQMPVDVLTLQVPNGAWLVTGRLTALLSPTTTFVNCFLVSDSADLTGDFTAIVGASATVVPLSVGAVLPAHGDGVVRLRCNGSPSDTSVATFMGVSLTAVAVDHATGTIVPADP